MKRSRVSSCVAVIPVLAALTACSGGDVRARGATVEYDTVGDTIVARAEGPALWGDDVVVQEEVRIGELEGADEYTFGSVASIAVDDSGAIYVLDQQALTVRKYDANGRHLQNIGRSGSGPGELKQPHGLGFLPDGRLVVRDWGNARINLYDDSGGPAGTIVRPGGFSTSTALQVDTAGNIYSSAVVEPTQNEPGKPQRMFRMGYHRFDVEGNVQDTVRRPLPDFAESTLLATSPDGRGISATMIPFTPNVQWTIDRNGNVVWGVSDSYTIRTLRDGRPFHITRSVPTVPVESGEKSAEQERITRNMKQTQPNWSWSGPGIPDTKPFFRSLTIADDNRIWVLVHQPATREPADTTIARAPGDPPPLDRYVEPLVYDIYEPDGQWLARVRVPDRFRPLVMRGDYIWGVQRDELDVNYVVRLRMVH